MIKTNYKLLVVGAGSGGIACARRAAKFIKDIAVIENKKPGGTCVNLGCVPKKILWNIGIMKKELEIFNESGIIIEEAKFAQWSVLRQKKQAYIHKLNDIYLKNMANDGIDYIKGLAQLVDKNTVRVGDQTYTADKIVLALGSKPLMLDVPGKELAITSDDYFHLEELPASMIIVGSGYIGVETACTLMNFGVDITLIIRKKHILGNQDQESADFIIKMLEKRPNFKILREVSVKAIEEDKASSLKITKLSDGTEVKAESILVAVGREPLTTNIGLEKAEVSLGKRNEILVDTHFKTSVDNIWAIGDCIDRVQLTPVAIREGRILAESLFNPENPKFEVNYENIPTVVFSDPPYASCGLTQEEAIKKYGKDDLEIYKTTFKNMYFALALEERKEETLYKLIGVKSLNKQIIGAHLVGKASDEMIQIISVAMKMGATKRQFDAAIAVHPTASEELVLLSPHHL